MIRRCSVEDEESIFRIVNQAAKAYKGVIPDDRYKEPYMPREELREEMGKMTFYGYEQEEGLIGVMGLQPIDEEITLIRHAYVLPSHQRRGIGGKLLNYLVRFSSPKRFLAGTWRDAWWAIRFYQKHGFRLLTDKDELLRKYWDIPQRQIETSVVLGIARMAVAKFVFYLTLIV